MDFAARGPSQYHGWCLGAGAQHVFYCFFQQATAIGHDGQRIGELTSMAMPCLAARPMSCIRCSLSLGPLISLPVHRPSC